MENVKTTVTCSELSLFQSAVNCKLRPPSAEAPIRSLIVSPPELSPSFSEQASSLARINRAPNPSDGVVLPVHSPAAPLHRLPLRLRRGPPRRWHPPLLRQHRATACAHARPRPIRPGLPTQEARQVSAPMALAPTSSGSGPVIAEVEMNAGADQGAATVRATVVQASTVFYDTPATLDKAEKLVAEAAGYGSQLVLFPEVFVGGYPHGSTFGLIVGNRSAKGKEDFRKYHAAAIDVPGPEVSRLAVLAGKYKVFLVIGVVERAGYTLYNTVLSFDPLGKYLGKHRKMMPTSLERVFWGFGDGSTIPVYDTLGKIGSAICWENRMPLFRTAMYAKGVQIYCAPTVDCMSSWQASMTHIALEGGCFVLSAVPFTRRRDYPPPPEYTFGGLEEEPSPESVVCSGGSVIISPSGTVLAGPNYEGEALLTADLDLGEIVRAKFDFDVVGHYSRPEVLSLVVKTDPKPAVSFISAAAKGDDDSKS